MAETLDYSLTITQKKAPDLGAFFLASVFVALAGAAIAGSGTLNIVFLGRFAGFAVFFILADRFRFRILGHGRLLILLGFPGCPRHRQTNGDPAPIVPK